MQGHILFHTIQGVAGSAHSLRLSIIIKVMAYKRSYRPKRRVMRRKRGHKKSSKGARRQQRAANTVIRKKYTKVFLMECEDGSDVFENTVSLIGGRNSSGAPDDTVTLGDVNQD